MQISTYLAVMCRTIVGVSLSAFVVVLADGALAKDFVSSKEAKLVYSPNVERTYPSEVFWGDTHVHTGMSMDAGAFGARLTPADAYRFARGEQVTSSSGQPAKLSRPLDFLVVADHSDNMGFFPALLAGEPSLLADPTGQRWYDMINEGGQRAVGAAIEIITSFTDSKFPPALAALPGTATYQSAWTQTIDAAESYNKPGQFTAFIGYEWTSTEDGINLHRNVIYRDGAEQARMLEPFTTQKPAGSPNPRDLWRWMERYEQTTGGQLLAIAHNGNLSNGLMFPILDPDTGLLIDREYAEIRARWEPLYEATQIKGDGETHPKLSPDDEFADYETWDQGNLDLTELKKDEMLQREYARRALQLGLAVEQSVGVNPYKFGLIGATDSHTALATASEDNFFGKHSGAEPSPERTARPMAKFGELEYPGWSMASSGYQGVWAIENTREALFDAMMRRETYATTGSRIRIRFFGGWHFDDQDVWHSDFTNIGYAKGVPMGGDLRRNNMGADEKDHKENRKSPSFVFAAAHDPLSGNLDRIQIIKGWVNQQGKRQEKVYNVVWSGDRLIDHDGKLPSVGNTVDIATATWTNTIGEPALRGVWHDPDFDPEVPSVYYARVLEIPTPRWTAYDAARFNIEMPSEDVPMITQERAYTSPIWYTP